MHKIHFTVFTTHSSRSSVLQTYKKIECVVNFVKITVNLICFHGLKQFSPLFGWNVHCLWRFVLYWNLLTFCHNVLNVLSKLLKEIPTFLETKEQTINKLDVKGWLIDLVVLLDIISFKWLKFEIAWKRMKLSLLIDSNKAFKTKLCLLITDLKIGWRFQKLWRRLRITFKWNW